MVRCFLMRHPDISLRQPTATSVARAMGFNQAQVERFYVNLTALKDKTSHHTEFLIWMKPVLQQCPINRQKF